MSLGPERSDVVTPAGPAGAASEQPTRQLSLAQSGEQCVNCGVPLASDQRYCVTCGERRGKPRFTLAGPHEEAVRETVSAASASTPRRPRTSAAFNLIAGVATLLLAMGVGVLIGHNSSSNAAPKSAATPNITINGGGTPNGSTSAAASTGSGSSSGSGATSAGKSKKSAAKSAKNTQPKVVVQKAAAAASKVTGGSAKVAGATDTVGSSCNAGEAGCQNGKLTGNYFGQ
jgi:hypothetical protein